MRVKDAYILTAELRSCSLSSVALLIHICFLSLVVSVRECALVCSLGCVAVPAFSLFLVTAFVCYSYSSSSSVSLLLCLSVRSFVLICSYCHEISGSRKCYLPAFISPRPHDFFLAVFFFCIIFIITVAVYCAITPLHPSSLTHFLFP